MSDFGSGTFVYANPARIFWGAGCVAQHLDGEIERLGATRVFLVGTRSVGANPALASRLQEQLGRRHVGSYLGIGQHAPVQSVHEAIEAARAAEPDLLVSLGGGSPVDAAKTVAFALTTGLDVLDPDAARMARKLQGSGGPPLVPHLPIPTTLSAAELGHGAGFTEATRVKSGLFAREVLPTCVFYDAEYAVHTPLPLWLSTGIRAIDHAVEGMLAPEHNPHSDALSLEALRRLRNGLLWTRRHPDSLDARTECQVGAWLSLSMPAASGFGLSHMLGKQVGAPFDVPHGVTSCAILPHVLRFRAQDPALAPVLARIAEALGADLSGLSRPQSATRAADALDALIDQLELPKHLASYGIGEEHLVEAVRPISGRARGAYGTEEEMVGILRAAL